MIRKSLINILLICSVFLLFSCGGQGDKAPAGSTMTINPSELTMGALSGDTINNFSVTVLNAQGIPLNNVDLTISGSFAAPRSPARYQFYKRIDASEPVNSSFTAKTDQEGVYEFSILIPALVGGSANAFLDNIEVRSATVNASVAVSLNQTTTP